MAAEEGRLHFFKPDFFENMLHKAIMPDVSGLLLVAGTWAPLAASWYEPTVQWLQLGGLVLGILVSFLAVIDFCMKIHWKMQRIKEEKQARKNPSKDERAKGTDRG